MEEPLGPGVVDPHTALLEQCTEEKSQAPGQRSAGRSWGMQRGGTSPPLCGRGRRELGDSRSEHRWGALCFSPT